MADSVSDFLACSVRLRRPLVLKAFSHVTALTHVSHRSVMPVEEIPGERLEALVAEARR